MVALALAALATLAPGSFSSDLDADRPDALLDFRTERRSPCDERQGWVGDGEDGRDPPPCVEPDGDDGGDPAGLHEPDWLGTGSDDDPATDDPGAPR